jgi:hypothetical protein
MAALLSDRAVSAVEDRVSGWREGLRRCGISEADAPIVYFRDHPADRSVVGRGEAAYDWSEHGRWDTGGAGDSTLSSGGGAPPSTSHYDGYGAAEATALRLLRHGLPGSGARPTAIVGYGDGPAHSVLVAAATLGLDVPRQLSVIGLGNTIAPYTCPPLCTHDTHAERVGAAAMALLTAALRGETAERRHVLVPTDFVCRGARGSCAAAPPAR